MTVEIIEGDCLAVLGRMPEKSVHCVVTSPPYWGLRDYGVAGQLGLEKTPEEYVEKMVGVFREVRRVLRDDGTLWLNMGDSYACTPVGSFNGGGNCVHGRDLSAHAEGSRRNKLVDSGLKPKDLVGIPWRLAFALQADGWYLRSDIIWHKPNPMPESVTDRPTKSHEYVFLLSKRADYFYDAEAIKEPCSESTHARLSQDLANQVGSYRANGGGKTNGPMKAVIAGSTRKLAAAGSGTKNNDSYASACVLMPSTRNKRTVWEIPTEAFSEAHFATFPQALVKPCILAGTSARGCCPKCGAPWERVVEKERWPTRPGNLIKADESRHDGGRADRVETESTTTGWNPACECFVVNDHIAEDGSGHVSPLEPIPCTVLDPFGGSGTVGQVALELGRKAILIELNPKYVELARSRTFVTPGLQLA